MVIINGYDFFLLINDNMVPEQGTLLFSSSSILESALGRYGIVHA